MTAKPDVTPGVLYIISAPSGAGKTSLVKKLAETAQTLVVSVSFTTRPARPGENDGIDYYFVDEKIFHDMVEKGAFIEHAEVFDHSYGTSRPKVLRSLQQGISVVLEIDWQGARQIRAVMPDCISIFILPPTRSALEQRLKARKQDNAAVIARRMEDAINEIKHYKEYDHIVINDCFDTALAEICAILEQRASDGPPDQSKPAPSEKAKEVARQLLA